MALLKRCSCSACPERFVHHPHSPGAATSLSTFSSWGGLVCGRWWAWCCSTWTTRTCSALGRPVRWRSQPPATTSCGGSAPSATSPSGSPQHPAWYTTTTTFSFFMRGALLLTFRSRRRPGGGRVASVLPPAARAQGEVAQRSLHSTLHPRGGQQPRALGAPRARYNTQHSAQRTAHNTRLSGSPHRRKGRRGERR